MDFYSIDSCKSALPSMYSYIVFYSVVSGIHMTKSVLSGSSESSRGLFAVSAQVIEKMLFLVLLRK